MLPGRGSRTGASTAPELDGALARVNANRARMRLAPIDDVLRYVVTDHPLLATDPTLTGAAVTDGLTVTQTGAWMLEDSSPLPRELEAFLDDGAPPIYFGFGSMPVAAGIGDVLVEAARTAGRRAIISRGWAGFRRARTHRIASRSTT